MLRTTEPQSLKKKVGKKEEFEFTSLIDNCKQIPHGDKLILRERLKLSDYEIIIILRAQKKKPDMLLLNQQLRKYLARLKENSERGHRRDTEPVPLADTFTEEARFLLPRTENSLEKRQKDLEYSEKFSRIPSAVSFNRSPIRDETNKGFIKFSEPFLQNRIKELQSRYDSHTSFNTFSSSRSDVQNKELYAVNHIGGSASIWRLPKGSEEASKMTSVSRRGDSKSSRESRDSKISRDSSRSRQTRNQKYQTPKKMVLPQNKFNCTPSPHYQKRVVFNLEKTEKKPNSRKPSASNEKPTASKNSLDGPKPWSSQNAAARPTAKGPYAHSHPLSKPATRTVSPQSVRAERSGRPLPVLKAKESKGLIDEIFLKALGEKWGVLELSAEEIFKCIFDDNTIKRMSKSFFRMKFEAFLMEKSAGRDHHFSEKSIDLFFDSCDLKKDKLLDHDEFGQCLQVMCDRNIDQNIMKLCFVALDSEVRGFIPKDVLKAALVSSLPLGASNEVYAGRMMERMMMQTGLNNDEQITYWSVYLRKDEPSVKDVFDSLRPILVRKNLL